MQQTIPQSHKIQQKFVRLTIQKNQNKTKKKKGKKIVKKQRNPRNKKTWDTKKKQTAK